jgi:hypothetical protein
MTSPSRAEGGLVTDQTEAPSAETVPDAVETRSGPPLGRTLVWLGIAGVSATLTFVIVRATMRRPAPPDATADRIQALIDEANRLIKTLDEKKPT